MNALTEIGFAVFIAVCPADSSACTKDVLWPAAISAVSVECMQRGPGMREQRGTEGATFRTECVRYEAAPGASDDEITAEAPAWWEHTDDISRQPKRRF